jgi:hypothetical protein
VTTTFASTRVNARFDAEPSRGLWLVKWVLLIPHLVVLSLLWLAFTVLTVVAFFAILFTGRYPRSLFEFNLGVLRWTWRVWFYGYGGLATDRYPPFSLGPEPDYPATLDIPYPERLSRGLVLVKWWLLALPHYVVAGFFVGGGFVLWRFGGGLVTVLVLIAGVVLLFTGRYPRGIFDLVLGMNRWAFRVGAYAALMTDEYPPFRMDLGPADPAGPAERPEPDGAGSGATPRGWTAGRVVGVVAGVLLLVTGFGAVAGGGTLLWADTGYRDSAGYVSLPADEFTDTGYALRFDVDDVIHLNGGWFDGANWLGDVRVRVVGSDTAPLFVGIARTADVARYLDAVPHGRFDGRNTRMMFQAMRFTMMRPPAAPAEQGIWAASTSGAVPLTLTWTPQPGSWSLVVMNADASRGLRADVDFGATVPALRPLWITLLAAGGVLLAGGTVLVAVTARARTRGRATP